MAYAESKVYYDGSHYIAIPHTERRPRKRPRREEELVEVKESTPEETPSGNEAESSPPAIEDEPFRAEIDGVHFEELTEIEDAPFGPPTKEKKEKPPSKMTTRKEIFKTAYEESRSMKKNEREEYICKALEPYFKDADHCRLYVVKNIEREQRNLICRRVRMVRKANLQEFNYFCTFTYDSKKHTEESFQKKLKTTLSNFSKRKGWKYIGVWERSPEKQRLHFHGIFYIPDGTMPGMILDIEDYSFNTHKRQITHQNLYFEEHFGRNDFEPIEDQSRLGDAMAYLMKYLEKTGEKIVYSKGLPQYFISDILEDDVVCTYGREDAKLLLFDDFSCWDEGVYVGQVGKETIAQLRKAN